MSSTADISTDDYKSRTGQSEIPVQSDTAKVESTEYDNGADSDKQLGTSSSVPQVVYKLLTSHREGRKRRD
jgi:hypothetical protein